MDCPGQPWLVLGAFGELGPDSQNMHTEIGELIKASGVIRLLATGADTRYAVEAFGPGATYFDTQEALIASLRQELIGNETILVKGSRMQRMENVVATLVDNFRN
jgi:UDP-N-acetylmuramoyl-tripeptide--D-alanyl-D-alanine ligase